MDGMEARSEAGEVSNGFSTSANYFNGASGGIKCWLRRTGHEKF